VPGDLALLQEEQPAASLLHLQDADPAQPLLLVLILARPISKATSSKGSSIRD
jgi:hypothetical protein